MTDINQVITLGIGTPGDIEHFILFGLSTATVGAINLTARPRLADLDVDTRIAQTARGSRISLDMDSRDD